MDTSQARLRRTAKAVQTTARAIEDELQEGGFRYKAALITLTYAPGEQWSPRDISSLCTHYRNWARRRGIRIAGVWVLEMQQRGVPHYHLVLFVPRGYTPPMPDKQGWWTKGYSNCKWARSPVGYIAKYASKADSKACPPKGARLHGHIGLSASMQAVRSYWLAPRWFRAMLPEVMRVVKRGLRWVAPQSGFWSLSPWICLSARNGVVELFWRGFQVGDFGWEWGEDAPRLSP